MSTRLACGALLLAVACAAQAQSPLPGGAPSAADAAGGRNPAGAPIAAALVPTRATAAEAEARAAVDRAVPGAGDAALLHRFERLEAGIEALRGRREMGQLDRLPLTRLEVLHRQWRFYATELALLQRQLGRRAGTLSAGAAELGELLATWRATAGDPSLPEPLRVRAAGVVAMLESAERTQARPLADAVELQERVTRATDRVARAERQVVDALAWADQRLFALDAPPLWAPQPRGTGAAPDVAESLRAEAAYVREYFGANPERVRGWLAASVLLLAVVAWLRRRRGRDLPEGDGALQDQARLLLRPWSAWLLIVLVVALFAFPLAPAALVEATLLALVVPMLRLVPGWLMQGARAGAWVVAALFVAERLRYLALDDLAHRWALLATSVAGAVALGWLAWRVIARPVLGARARAFARWALLIGAALLAIAAVANAAGNVTLADLLTRATITGTFTAVLLYAGVAVLRGVLALLLATPSARRLRVVEHHAEAVRRVGGRLIGAVAVAGWTIAVLSDFRVWQALRRDVGAALSAEFGVGEATLSLGSVLLFALGVWLAVLAARFVRFVLEEEILARVAWPRGVKSTVSTLSFYAIAALGFLVALGAAGFEVGRFAIVAGALGVGIGFGLQNVVNNFVSGLILMFERPIQPGDVVEVAGIQGTVKSIGMRATVVETFEGADVIVPNGTLLQGNLTNWTLRDRNRRVEIPVGVAYGTDPKAVLAILDAVAREEPKALRHPAPVALFQGFGDSSLNFLLRFWTDEPAWPVVRSAALVRIHEALAARGIEVPFPQRDLHVRSVAPDAARALAGTAPPR